MINPEIIYEDKRVVVVNKPAGILVHGAKGKAQEEETVADWFLRTHPEVAGVGDKPEDRAGIVHRLDKETSGVLILAKTQEAFLYLKEQFQNRETVKTYYAVVAGTMHHPKGIIMRPIGLKSGTTKRTVNVKNAKMVKDAVTEYCVEGDIMLENTNNSPKPCTIVRVTPKTGRTHQIRVHLASIAHPVVGDALYGGKAVTAKGIKRHMLHAYKLEISISPKKRMIFCAPFPKDMDFVANLDNKA